MAPRVSSQHHHFFATCPRNTEGLLLDELRSLGAAGAAETRAGVSFTGPLALAYKACLWSRVASRVLLQLGTFVTSGPDDLYEAVHLMPWEEHLDAEGTLAVEVTSTVTQGPLAGLNTHFAEQRVKDAVVDRFRAACATRPGVDLARPNIRINVHFTPAEALISLDLSGEGLHRRGYRLEGGQAPLKENLAAAILIRAGWPRIAPAGGPLLDPMCGSGSLLIEGALMAGDVAPGLLRDYFGFLGWRGFDPLPWRELLQEAAERREQGLSRLPPLFGFDADARALGAARANARRAGLAGRISLERREIASLAVPRADTVVSGLVMVNPPYGKRLGEISELVGVYETLGAKLKESFSGWEAAVFTGNPELGAHLGLRAHRTNLFYNGPLPCRLLQFHIDPATYRAVGGGSSRRPAPAGPTVSAGALMFANRLRKNLKHLRRWTAREHVTCYRAYDADLPEYAVAVDIYGDWVHVQEYAPPPSVDPVLSRRRLKEAMAVIPEVLGMPAEHVVLKVRRPQRGAEQYQKLSDAGRFLEVEEGGLRFLVNLTDYLDTGLFLDHRITRGLLRELSPGKRFLNLFGYTGTASVYSAAGGATSTTTVDLSQTYLDWARRNLALNGFSGPEHGFVRADCTAWLTRVSPSAGAGPSASGHPSSGRGAFADHHRSAGRARGATAYDLIFLDAPTFSNSKGITGTLDIQRDHPQLIRLAAGLLSEGGVMLFSTNYRRFKLDPALTTEFEVVDITKETLPPDFVRNPRVHRCFRLNAKRVR